MSELSEIGAVLAAATGPVVAVRVAQRSGLGSVPSGELAVRGGGVGAGRLLGGAADGAVDELVAQVLAGGGAVTRVVALGEATAVAAGLACGGSVTLLAHPLQPAEAAVLGAALALGEPVALAAGPAGVRVLTGPDLDRGAGTLGPDTDAAVTERAVGLLRRGVSVTEHLHLDRDDVDGEDVLLDLWVPVPQVLVVGAGVLGAAITAQAAVLGWTSRTVLEVAETEAAVGALTAADVLVLLDHSPAFDAALLACARGPAFAGALGSRHTQAARRERLAAAGATTDDLRQVHGPVGLDLGARTPAETAVSIIAEVLALRGGRAPGALGVGAGRIGV